MRFAVLADIHGNLPALEAVAAHIRAERLDAVLNLGDIVSGPLFPRETAQFVMGQDWVHLAGNHERQLLDIGPHSGASDVYAHGELGTEEFAWLGALPGTIRLEGDILLCHGTPTSDMVTLLEEGDRPASRAQVAERLGDTDAALVLCGHSHVPRSVRCDGRLIVNPGSVGLPAYAHDHPFAHVIETGSPDARYAIVERRAGAWSASLVSVPYAVDHAVAAATARGRADWATALLTGYAA